MRIEVVARSSCPDGRANRLARSLARAFPPGPGALAIVDVYLLQGVPDLPREELAAIFSDPVAQEALFDEPAAAPRAPRREHRAGTSGRPAPWHLAQRRRAGTSSSR